MLELVVASWQVVTFIMGEVNQAQARRQRRQRPFRSPITVRSRVARSSLVERRTVHSHIVRTAHPMERKRRSFRASRARLPAIFASQ